VPAAKIAADSAEQITGTATAHVTDSSC